MKNQTLIFKNIYTYGKTKKCFVTYGIDFKAKPCYIGKL